MPERASYDISGADLSQFFSGGGFDIEGTFVLKPEVGDARNLPASSFCWFSTEGGTETSLRFDHANVALILRVNGVDVVQTANEQPFVQTPAGVTLKQNNDTIPLTFRAWYIPNGGPRGMGIRVSVGGVVGYDTVGVAPSTSVAVPTKLHFGTSPGFGTSIALPANFLNARGYTTHTDVLAEAVVRGIVLGDSVTAGWEKGPPVGVAFPSVAQRSAGYLSFALSEPAATVADQLGAWQVSSYRGRSSLQWVIVQLGLNDIHNGQTAAQIVTSLQTLVDDIASSTPNARILIGQMTPGRTYWNNAALNQIELDVNNSIMGVAGAIPIITGIAASADRISMADLDDGTGALKTIYDVGDQLHPNTAGRLVMGAAYRARLVALGLL